MSAPKQLSWENFRSTVFLSGEQRLHLVSDSPYIEIFGDGISNRIGIWLETLPEKPIPSEFSKLDIITIRRTKNSGRLLLEASTGTVPLFRNFYHFAVAVSERMILEKIDATEAILSELECFNALLEERSFLGFERQLGLLGELIFLERLIQRKGVDAIDSWIGPIGEPHDFRISNREFEVKTTISSQRIHLVHGTEQLVPSSECSLYLVSVLLGPTGASPGFSLTEKVAQVSNQLAPESSKRSQFLNALKLCGFRAEDGALYTRRFSMRRPIGIVAVDSAFPAITRSTIQTALGPLAPRIDGLQYEVNVEGLEHEDDTEEFNLVSAD
jgi:hypothetical protein